MFSSIVFVLSEKKYMYTSYLKEIYILALTTPVGNGVIQMDGTRAAPTW